MMLQGRVALVTGAARGTDAAISRTLAEIGAMLTLLGRNEEALQRVATELGGSHGVADAEVRSPDEVRESFERACAERGSLRILVNNAGQAESAPIGRTSLHSWQKMLEVNLTGTFLCSQEALPHMLSAGGRRIVNVASSPAHKGYPYVCSYVTAKHGVLGLTGALAIDVATKGFAFNAFRPANANAEILRESVIKVMTKAGPSEAAARAEFAAANRQKRIGQPQEVTDAFCGLCSERRGRKGPPKRFRWRATELCHGGATKLPRSKDAMLLAGEVRMSCPRSVVCGMMHSRYIRATRAAGYGLARAASLACGLTSNAEKRTRGSRLRARPRHRRSTTSAEWQGHP